MARDLYLELEAAVRRPERKLLIDALLPAPGEIPTSLPPEAAAPAAALPEPGSDIIGNLRETLEKMTPAESKPVAPHPPPRQAKPAPERGSKRIEDEIQEFLQHQRNRGVHGSPGLEVEAPEPADPDPAAGEPPEESF